jgi:hypothetical protein
MPLAEFITGNDVFDRAAYAIGLDATATRHLLRDTFKVIGVTPHDTTIDQLGGLLPELERRLRLLVPPDVADGAMQRLRSMILKWDD